MHAYITKLADDMLTTSWGIWWRSIFAHLMFNLSLSLDVNGSSVMSCSCSCLYSPRVGRQVRPSLSKTWVSLPQDYVRATPTRLLFPLSHGFHSVTHTITQFHNDMRSLCRSWDPAAMGHRIWACSMLQVNCTKYTVVLRFLLTNSTFNTRDYSNILLSTICIRPWHHFQK